MNTTMKQTRAAKLVLIAMMAALMCILGPFSIPIGPVPITLTNFVIYIGLLLLGWKKGTVSYLIYLLIGLVGIPVFSGFSGGAGKLFGPTGGYLIGFIFLALIGGWAAEQFYENKMIVFIGMVLGTAVCYLFGTFWLAYQSSITYYEAFAVGVLPFIVGDLVKIVLGMGTGYLVRRQLVKANLL